MDKMLDKQIRRHIVTNDGHTILDEMELQHPAARMMVDVAKTQQITSG
jgi:chaperonin GroEL (HSP60 family)